jgi:hypothetical protein
MPYSIFTRSLALPGGLRVRLRLARPADAAHVERLLGTRPLDARRLLRFDPSRRAVLCASVVLDGTETLVGVGGIDLRDDAEPDAVVADERLAPGLGDLVREVLRRRARSRSRRVA